MDSAKSLAAILRDDPSAPRPGEIDHGLVDAAVQHGVAALVHRALTDAGTLGELDEADRAVAERLRQLARESVLIDAVQSRDLAEVMTAFAQAGVRPLLFKGAALAATHYAAPGLRPRGDADLLVLPGDINAACRVLEGLGFRRLPRPTGVHVTHQARYVGSRGPIEIAYDVHWRLADPQAFAEVLSYAELEEEAVAEPQSGGRRLGDVHALLVACIHRVAHHYDTDSLIFLYDVDRIARGLNAGEWERFTTLAETRRVRAVCARGLDLAVEMFETPVPFDVRHRLAMAGEPEPTASYLASRLRRVDILRSDLRELPTWGTRAALIREHLFPSRDYMVATVGPPKSSFSAIFYLRRIARGARGWFRDLT